MLGRALAGSQGVYVLYSEAGVPMYTGRSRNIGSRLRMHLSGGMEGASLASKLARLEFLDPNPGRRSETRKRLAEDPGFQQAFALVTAQIRKMKVRVVEIADPIEQTVFEIYAHMELGTRFNSFETS